MYLLLLLTFRLLFFQLIGTCRLAIGDTFSASARPSCPRLGVDEILPRGQLFRNTLPSSVIVQVQPCSTAPEGAIHNAQAI